MKWVNRNNFEAENEVEGTLRNCDIEKKKPTFLFRWGHIEFYVEVRYIGFYVEVR